jgi:hypothetical protein
MLRKLFVLTGVAALGWLALSSLPASQALNGPGVIRITDREIRFSVVDLGRRGRSPGDLSVTRRLLYNKGITPRPIGHSELVCVYTGGGSSSCNGTYTLPAGKIVVGGAIHYRQFFQLAVTGGTGRYNNVGGTLTVTSLGGRPRRDLVLFRLVV